MKSLVLRVIAVFTFLSVFAISNFTFAAVPFVSLDSMSETTLCGTRADGTSACIDAQTRDLDMPQFLDPNLTAQDIVVNDLGICWYGASGVSCWYTNDTAPELVQFLESSDRATVKTSKNSVCSLHAQTRNLQCYVPTWSLLRKIVRVTPSAPVTAIGAGTSRICWSEGNVVHCLDQAMKRTAMVIADTTVNEIMVLYEAVCARGPVAGQCRRFDDGAEYILPAEFVDARQWVSHDYEMFCALTADRRIVCYDLDTGTVHTGTGRGRFDYYIPAEYTVAGSPVRELSMTNLHLCVLEDGKPGRTCWYVYDTVHHYVQFLAPVKFSAGSRYDQNCSYLENGRLFCASTGGITSITLDRASRIRTVVGPRFRCYWNESGFDCPVMARAKSTKNLVYVASDISLGAVCGIEKPASGPATAFCLQSYGPLGAIPSSVIDPTSISVARNKACAIVAGAMICWGDGYAGDPPPIQFLNLKKISLGERHACGIDDLGLSCWGDLAADSLQIPAGLDQPGAVLDFALGETQTCAILADRSVKCWGRLTQDDETAPALTNVQQLVSSRLSGFCAVTGSGTARATTCWGVGQRW